MPTVEFDYREVNSLLGNRFKLEDLKEKIPMLGVDLESIDEDKITMEVFPNRPDLLSVEGFVRALDGFLGIEKGLREYKAAPSGVTLYIENSVEDVRPYICGAVIRNLSLDEDSLISLMNLQEKLHVTHGRHRKKVAIGVHDMKNIEEPYTYKAVKPDSISFVPLDMSEEYTLREILVEHPKGRDYAFVLDGLIKYPIIVDRKNQVLSFPPIINGELTRLSESTKDLFVEVTGLDELAVNQAVNIIVTSIADRGGKIQTIKLNKK